MLSWLRRVRRLVPLFKSRMEDFPEAKVLGLPPGKNKTAYTLYDRPKSVTKGSEVVLQLVGSAHGDPPPSLLVSFLNRKYLFNAGDGTQRFCFENRMRLSRLSSAYFTQLSSQTLGGTPGLALSIQENYRGRCLKMVGPSGLADYLSACRHFFYRPHMKLHVAEYPSGSQWFTSESRRFEDEDLSVIPIVLDPPRAGEEPDQKRARLGDSIMKRHAHFVERVPGTPYPRGCAPPGTSISYLCYTAPTQGKFNPKAAQDLKVPKGPLFGKLQRGESVVLDDGRVVEPSEVVEPSTPGPAFAVIDVQSEEQVTALKGSEELKRHMTGGKSVSPLVCMVHFTSAEVWSTEAYKEWMKMFPNTRHVLMPDTVSAGDTGSFLSSDRIRYKLSRLNPEVFPPPSTGAPVAQMPLPDDILENAVWGSRLLKLTMQAGQPLKIDTSDLMPTTLRDECANLDEELASTPEFTEKAKTYAEVLAESAEASRYAHGCRLYTLGTGAAIPARYRNVTGNYLEVQSHGGVLMDCGEGTYGQMCRAFGLEGARTAVKNLKVVWISHMHADHHLGLVRILSERMRGASADEEPLLVIGPKALRQWLSEYANSCERLKFTFVYCGEIEQEWPRVKPSMDALGVTAVACPPAVHCYDSYSIVMDHKDGWRLSLSGDTRPSDALVEAGKGSTLLVHEATFEDDMKDEAVARKHSTAREAVDVGLRMNAERILLTHFSQRYPRIPTLDNGAGQDRTFVAFDLMAVDLGRMQKLPMLMPPLEVMFAEDLAPDEDKEILMPSAEPV